MQKNILITGCSSGLGLALSKFYLENGYKVYGLSRTNPEILHENFEFKAIDLSDTDNIKLQVQGYLNKIKNFEIVYLNAGKLGKINDLESLSLDEIQSVYEINVYANKQLLDILKHLNINFIIGISSGASKNGYFGWGSYCLSKAGLNMLINLYSNEFKNTKLLALAPGVIQTPMTDYIRFDVDDEIYTSAKQLKNASLQTPNEAAKRIHETILKTSNISSGSFIDVRDF